MSGKASPARQLLLSLQDEGGVADLSLDEVLADLAALGIDPAASVAVIKKQAGRPAALRRPVAPPPPPEPETVPEPAPATLREPDPPPLRAFEPPAEPTPPPPPPPDPPPGLQPIAGPAPDPIPEPVRTTPRPPGVARYRDMQPGTPQPAADLMADMRIRADGAEAIEGGRKPAKKRSAFAMAGMLVVMAGLAVVTIRVWPEMRDLDVDSLLDRIDVPQPTQQAEPAPAEPLPETDVTVGRVEPVPPPAPPPEPEPAPAATPAPAPAPAPQPAPAPAPAQQTAPQQATASAPQQVAPAPQPAAPATAAQPAAAADPNAPLNIVPRVQAPEAPAQVARLPENVERPFTAPPSITAILAVERELLAEAGTGILASGARSGGRSSDESRLAGRVEEAQRIAAGRQIAAIVALQSAEGPYDAVILKRPRVDETRTIADADPALIPILGDTAHLFDLVRLAPR